MDGRLAVDAMVRDFLVILAWTPVGSWMSGSRGGGVYPVLDAGGALVGTLDLGELKARPDLHDRLVGEVCSPIDALSVLGLGDRVVPERLPGLVLDQGRLIGIVRSRPRPVRSAAQLRKAS